MKSGIAMTHNYDSVNSVTVLINAHNYGRFIDRAIESALAQNVAPYDKEIIVVDDGSTDDTKVRVSRYGCQVQYYYQPQSGQGAAINTGFRLSSSDAVCLLDADDYFLPNKLVEVIEAFNTFSNAGAVLNRYRTINSDGKILEASAPQVLQQGKLSARARYWRLPGVPTSGISIRRAIYSSLTIPEPEFTICADTFLLAVLPIMTFVAVITEPLHAYVIHSNNYFQSKPDAARKELLICRREAIGAYAESVLGQQFFMHGMRCEGALRRGQWGVALKEYSRGLQYLLVHRSACEIMLKEAVKPWVMLGDILVRRRRIQ